MSLPEKENDNNRIAAKPPQADDALSLSLRIASAALTAVSAIVLLVRLPLCKLGLFRAPDPWRRTLGIGLRGEASKFALSVFGLRFFSDETTRGVISSAPDDLLAPLSFTQRLAEFLRSEPDAHFALRQDRFCVCRKKVPHVDVTFGRFSNDGELQTIEPFLDTRTPCELDETSRRAVERAVVEAHRCTRDLPESKRPRLLLRSAIRRLAISTADASRNRVSRTHRQPFEAMRGYCQRLVESCFVSFENELSAVAADAETVRFFSPQFHRRRNLGLGFLNILCRPVRNARKATESVDIWMQIQHTGADGAPMQEMLARLEKTCGGVERALFPNAGVSEIELQTCSVKAEHPQISMTTAFVDFTPLIALRKKLNEQLNQRVNDSFNSRDATKAVTGKNVPLGVLLLWALAHQPEFDGVKFSIAIDVPANARAERAVDLAGIRPADYFPDAVSKNPDAGFSAFVRAFTALISSARERRSASYQAMWTMALLPSWLSCALLHVNPRPSRKTFGTMGISILRDAKVFVAPMADAGFEDGFIAIGGASLPAMSGGNVAAITIKSPQPSKLRTYPAAIARAVQCCRDFI